MKRPSFPLSKEGESFHSHHLLHKAYQEATTLDQAGMESLCPSYCELAETEQRYHDEKLIGKGGIKVVYRVFDSRTRRWVALARLRADRGPDFYDLFVQEAWLTSSLNHPNIIDIHDVGIDSDGRPFFTMDLKGDGTFADLIARREENTLHSLLEFFLKVCDAIAYSHDQNIIHLDLKPDNIQADSFGEVLVCDWGLGKFIGEEEIEAMMEEDSGHSFEHMTFFGRVRGSPGYMAPEQARVEAELDHRSDLFALGCILYTILTGDPPFTGNHAEVLKATSAGDILSLESSHPHLKIPPSLLAVTSKALEKDPNKRYQSASAFKEDIRRYLDGFSTQAESRSFIREAWLFFSRNKSPVVVGLLSLVLLTILGTLLVQREDLYQREIATETLKAKTFEEQANQATTQFLKELEQSSAQRKKLALQLGYAAAKHKHMGVFDSPLKAIQESSEMAETALSLNPESGKAQFELFTLGIITLDFQKALIYEPEIPTSTAGRVAYKKIVRSFPEFNYGRRKRPPHSLLVDFIDEVQEISLNEGPLMERIVSFDWSARDPQRRQKSYDEVIRALIRYLNPGVSFRDHYAPRASTLTLTFDQSLKLKVVRDIGGSGKCVLRFLAVQTLILRGTEPIFLCDLNALDVQKLDLTNCQAIEFNEPVHLPNLTEIHIRHGQIEVAALRKMIRSAGIFKVIVKKRK